MTSVPVFCCPKCGAVADINYISATTPQDVEAVQETIDWLTEWSATDSFYQIGLMQARSRLVEVRRRLSGPWLDCNCPRCAHHWQEVPLDTRDAGTPIYDALVSA